MNVVIANRQRKRRIDSRLLKQIIGALFAELKITEAELGINLVAACVLEKCFVHQRHLAGSDEIDAEFGLGDF